MHARQPVVKTPSLQLNEYPCLFQVGRLNKGRGTHLLGLLMHVIFLHRDDLSSRCLRYFLACDTK